MFGRVGGRAGGQAGRLAGRQNTDKFSKLAVGRKIQVFASFNQGTASLQPNRCIPAGFSDKAYYKVDF